MVIYKYIFKIFNTKPCYCGYEANIRKSDGGKQAEM